MELLQKLITPDVVQAERQAEKANSIHIIPPNRYLTISDSRLQLREPEKFRGMRMAINRLFCSLAKECGSQGVDIVLSGRGSGWCLLSPV